jgi:hypothetical protein
MQAVRKPPIRRKFNTDLNVVRHQPDGKSQNLLVPSFSAQNLKKQSRPSDLNKDLVNLEQFLKVPTNHRFESHQTIAKHPSAAKCLPDPKLSPCRPLKRMKDFISESP